MANVTRLLKITVSNLPSKERYILLIGTAFLAGLVLFVNASPGRGIFYAPLTDSSHTLVFALTTFLCLMFCFNAGMKHRQSINYYIWIVALNIGTGLLIEIIQPYFGRSRSPIDFSNDVIGAFSGALVFKAYSLSSTKHRQRTTILILAILIFTLGFIRPIIDAKKLIARNMNFPTLLDFESKWQRSFIRPNRGASIDIIDAPAAWTKNTSKVLQIKMSGGRYPGLSFHDPSVDWTSFSRISFDIYSPQQDTLEMSFRVHDIHHANFYNDRFNTLIEVHPGANHITIPLSRILNGPKKRKMDMKQISGLGWFIVRPKQEKLLYLDNVKLSGKP